MTLNWYKIGTLDFFHHYSNIQYLEFCEGQFTTQWRLLENSNIDSGYQMANDHIGLGDSVST